MVRPGVLGGFFAWGAVLGLVLLGVSSCAQPQPIVTHQEAQSVRELVDAIERHFPAAAGAIRKMTDAAEHPPERGPGFGDVVSAVLGVLTLGFGLAARALVGAVVARASGQAVAQVAAQPSRTGLSDQEVAALRARLLA